MAIISSTESEPTIDILMEVLLRVRKFALLSVIFFIFGAYAIDPIVVNGSKFFYKSDGTQFIVKGVRYQTSAIANRKTGDLASFEDPLQDDRICKQDIPNLLNLGINTLLVESFNAQREQTACMKAFSDAGIYVIVLINGNSEVTVQTGGSVGTPVGYVSVNHFFKAVDFFRKFNNTLGLGFWLQDFSRGKDEVEKILPLQKRYLGEVKEYIKSRGYRDIPLGYIGSEHVTKGFNIPKYLACGGDDTASEFYMTWPRCRDLDNWCSNSSAHYNYLLNTLRDYHRPVILAEGCRKGTNFGFEWLQDLYSPKMTEVFSGAIFHEWLASPKENGKPGENAECPDYLIPEGFVNVQEDNVTLTRAYSVLSRQLNAAEPTPARLSSSTQIKVSIQCDDLILKKGELQNVDKDVAIKPTLPIRSSETLCKCMMNTLPCVRNTDNLLEADLNRTTTIMSACADSDSPSQPKYCYGTRRLSDAGVYDSYIHCNPTEQISWQYSQFSNSSEDCKSLDGLVTTPTPTSSLNNTCQILVRQAGVSGTGTVKNFATDAKSVLTEASNGSSGLPVGMKVGIALALVFLILFIVGGYIIYRRVKMAAARKRALEAAEYEKAELPNSETRPDAIKLTDTAISPLEVHELEGSGPGLLEAGDGAMRVEVVGDFGAAELESNQNTPIDPERKLATVRTW